MQKRMLEVLSTDGVHTLRGILYLPQEAPRALIQISHGMNEHIARYEAFMEYLASLGYAVCGHDHIGHGKTAENDSELGFFAQKDGWSILPDDVYAFGKAVRAELDPALPYLLFGHSMGSFIARIFAARYGAELGALILCGTGGPNPGAKFGIALARRLAKKNGPQSYSAFVEKLAFGSYNKRTAQKSPVDWLSRDEAVLLHYAADPFCTFHFTVSALADLFTLSDRANSAQTYAAIPKDLPIYLICGDGDPVGNYAKGVRRVAEEFRLTGHTKTDLTVYPGCRHELLNEIGKERIMQDIAAWTDEVLSAAEESAKNPTAAAPASENGQ